MDNLLKGFLLLLCVAFAAAINCTTNGEVACISGERCIPQRYICDNDNDCADGSDEDTELCAAWKNNDCEKGKAQCTVNGSPSCVTIEEYCNTDKPKCTGTLDRRLCQILEDKLLQPLSSIRIRLENPPAEAYNVSVSLGSELQENINSTLSHPECPRLFTRVGDQCLSVFFVGSVSWGEARSFCKHLGADLITIRNVTHFTDVVNHLNKNQLTTDFWLGGRYELDTQSWVWLDGTLMTRGTPYWTHRRYERCSSRNVTVPGATVSREANNGQCYHYVQAPEDPPIGYCVAVTYAHHFYMSDEDCLVKRSPLCASNEPIGN